MEKTYEDMVLDVGEDLTNKVLEFFGGDKIGAVNWFYSSHPRAFGGLSPEKYYLKNGGDFIETLIIRLEHGVFS